MEALKTHCEKTTGMFEYRFALSIHLVAHTVSTTQCRTSIFIYSSIGINESYLQLNEYEALMTMEVSYLWRLAGVPNVTRKVNLCQMR